VKLFYRSSLSGERKVALRNGLPAQYDWCAWMHPALAAKVYVVQRGHLGLLMLEAAG
jgi:hypothetical protein